MSNKQETLEQAAKQYSELIPFVDAITTDNSRLDFEAGAKWQVERMYSEGDLLKAFEAGMMFIGEDKGSFDEWFEQYKQVWETK